jgi:hypothetical protein
LPEATLSPLPRAQSRKFTTASFSSDDEATFSTMIVATHANGRLTTASDCKDAYLRAGVAPPSLPHRHMKLEQAERGHVHDLPEPLPPAMLALAGTFACREPSVNSAGSSERFFRVIGTGVSAIIYSGVGISGFLLHGLPQNVHVLLSSGTNKSQHDCTTE